MSSDSTPLQGKRILDVSGNGAGAVACWLLAGLGAEVVKVEPPDGSDDLRTRHPCVDGISIEHLVFDRHKRSFAVDLRSDGGQDAYRAVAVTADAVIDGMGTGVAHRLGIGYRELCVLNPVLTYVHLTDYGGDGEHASAAGQDLNFEALAGVLSMTWPGPVAPPPIQAADYFAATLAALAAVSGIVAGCASGRGSELHSSRFDAAVFSMAGPLARALATATDVTPEAYPLIGELACYGVYECADGRHLAVGALEPHFWKRFCELAGIDDRGHQYSAPHQNELRTRVADAIRTRDRDEWAAQFEGEDACASAVLSVAETVRHPHLAARGGIGEVRHPNGSIVALPKAPLRTGDQDGIATVPAVGESTQTLLSDAGLGPGRIEELVRAGDVKVWSSDD